MKHSTDRAHFAEILADNSDERSVSFFRSISLHCFIYCNYMKKIKFQDFITLMRENLAAQAVRGVTDDDIIENAGTLRDFIDGMLQYDHERR